MSVRQDINLASISQSVTSLSNNFIKLTIYNFFENKLFLNVFADNQL